MHAVRSGADLRLQVAVDDAVRVAVLDARYDLLEEATRLVLEQPPVRHDVLEELPARHVLHDHEDVRRCLDHLIQLDDVWVPEQLQDLDLAPDLLVHPQVLDLLPVHDLHRHLMPRQLVLRYCLPVSRAP
jgi:hypothetical protein